MPANPKYLNQSKLEKYSKTLAGFLGGFAVSVSFHIALGAWLNRAEIAITYYFTGFLLWAVLMILAYLPDRSWKTWGLYLLLSLIFSAIAYPAMS